MNETFSREDDREKVQYATAAIFGNFRKIAFTLRSSCFSL
jgi:hypothetical protein